MIAAVLTLLLSADGAGYFPLPKGLKVKPETIATKPFDLTVKKPEQLALPNGLKIYLGEDHAAPLVSVRALIQVGNHDDPAAKLGLAELLFESLASGGAADKTAEQLDELLEQQAADLHASAGDEFSWVSLSMRSADFDRLMPVFADVVMRPRFQADRVEVAVSRMNESMRRRPDRPEGLAGRALTKAIFGPDSLIGREPTPATLKAVKPEDLKALHKRVFGPTTTSLLITGDFDKTQVIARITEQFAGWKGGGALKRDYGPPPKLERRVIFVPKQTAQVKVRIGGLGFKRLDPQEYAMRLVSTALGSFGVGRLYKEIRDERGLAYSAWASASSGPTTGTFTAGFDTKPENAASAIALGLPILEGKDGPLTKAELVTAADMAVNSFAFRFDSASKIAWERAVFDLLGFPDDYLDGFRDRIAKVDEAGANAARTAIAQGGQFQIVVVGPEDKVGDLSKLGPVTKITDVEAWK
ncbi:MAG: insulinase family protein [Myxococcaceae bacterium]|nr:insulinase family protein [Myxococcaceae bacterium]